MNGNEKECDELVEEAREPVGDRRACDLLEEEAHVVKQVSASANPGLSGESTAGVWCGTHCDIDEDDLLQERAPCQRCVGTRTSVINVPAS